ncbi:MAG: hypothetical protein AMXMBFR72_11130 [Betaproteobacteria bacterium]
MVQQMEYRRTQQQIAEKASAMSTDDHQISVHFTRRTNKRVAGPTMQHVLKYLDAIVPMEDARQLVEHRARIVRPLSFALLVGRLR